MSVRTGYDLIAIGFNNLGRSNTRVHAILLLQVYCFWSTVVGALCESIGFSCTNSMEVKKIAWSSKVKVRFKYQ